MCVMPGILLLLLFLFSPGLFVILVIFFPPFHSFSVILSFLLYLFTSPMLLFLLLFSIYYLTSESFFYLSINLIVNIEGEWLICILYISTYNSYNA